MQGPSDVSVGRIAPRGAAEHCAVLRAHGQSASVFSDALAVLSGRQTESQAVPLPLDPESGETGSLPGDSPDLADDTLLPHAGEQRTIEAMLPGVMVPAPVTLAPSAHRDPGGDGGLPDDRLPAQAIRAAASGGLPQRVAGEAVADDFRSVFQGIGHDPVQRPSAPMMSTPAAMTGLTVPPTVVELSPPTSQPTEGPAFVGLRIIHADPPEAEMRRLTMMLTPETLGGMVMVITRDDDGFAVVLTPDRPDTARLLAADRSLMAALIRDVLPSDVAIRVTVAPAAGDQGQPSGGSHLAGGHGGSGHERQGAAAARGSAPAEARPAPTERATASLLRTGYAEMHGRVVV